MPKLTRRLRDRLRRWRRVTHVGVARCANLQFGGGPKYRKLRDLRLLRDLGVSVIGCQEGSDRRDVIQAWLRLEPTWWAYPLPPKARRRRGRRLVVEDVPGVPAVPILWDGAVWQLSWWRALVAVARRWVGARGAGPTYAKAKAVTVLVLRHRETGQRVRFLCTHFLPSVRRKNLPAAEEAAREAHYRKHARRVARIVRRSRIPVVLFTDANAPADFGLLDPLHAAGLEGWVWQRTHAKAGAVDHQPSRGLDRLGQAFVRVSGDHLSVVVAYLLPRKRGGKHRG